MNGQDAVRVIVCDDQNISRGFFEMYVRAAAGFELTAGLRTAREAVDYLKEHEADLLILDVMMQDGIDGLSAATLIKKEHPQLKIILTTSAAETGWEDKARAIGVESFWYKEYDEHGIQEIMNRTMAGESVYPGDAPDVSFGKIKRSDLTDRELDVLRMPIIQIIRFLALQHGKRDQDGQLPIDLPRDHRTRPHEAKRREYRGYGRAVL